MERVYIMRIKSIVEYIKSDSSEWPRKRPVNRFQQGDLRPKPEEEEIEFATPAGTDEIEEFHRQHSKKDQVKMLLLMGCDYMMKFFFPSARNR